MISVIRGEKQPWTFKLISKKNNAPFALTGNVDIVVAFKIGSVRIVKKKTLSQVSVVGDVLLGTVTGFLEVADTNLFTPGKDGNVEVLVDFGGSPVDYKRGQFLRAFEVIERIND